MSQWVLGVEGDLDWSNIKGSAPCPNPAFTCRVSNTWLATMRGRLGFAASNWLLYATAGGAAGNVKQDLPVNPIAPALPGQTTTRLGWTGGFGAELGVTRNVSVKAEYLYVDLGTTTCSLNNCSAVDIVNSPFQIHTARVGVNWRFNNP